MKTGVSQKEAAKQAGVSAETLRRFQKANTTSQREDRRWVIIDIRPVSVVMKEKQNFIDSIIQGYPVPIILLAESAKRDDNSLEIIDGMQRLDAIVSLYVINMQWQKRILTLIRAP
jgi:hypothetical protein